ncbi:MAG: hypothetical protein IJ343_08545, partial [Clostridia bacterium]|nr:hypothetical protein [Clostridia bacterium]
GDVHTAQQSVPAKGHSPVTDAAVAPTCTETGLTQGSHCSVCSATLTAQQSVPAKGHSPVTDAAVAPTCTKTGLTEGQHCAVCSAVLTAQQSVPAKGHTPVTDAAVAPTCTETGLTEGQHCSVCAVTLTAQQSVPAKGHTPVTDAAVAPTCTGTGLTEGSHCAVCAVTLTSQKTVPAKGHDTYRVEGKPATCTQDGTTAAVYCSDCSQRLVAHGTAKALGHAYTPDVTAPTCLSGGTTRKVCFRCGDVQTGESLPALGHAFGAWVSRGSLHQADCANEGCRSLRQADCSGHTVRHQQKDHTICTICGTLDGKPMAALTGATVRPTKDTAQRGKLTMYQQADPFGTPGVLTLLTLAYEEDGYAAPLAAPVKVTLTMKLPTSFRLVHVRHITEGTQTTQHYETVQYARPSGQVTFTAQQDGVYLILPQ